MGARRAEGNSPSRPFQPRMTQKTGDYTTVAGLNSERIDSSAPVSSARSLAKQNLRYPSPFAPKSTPGTQPIRPFEIRNSVMAHERDVCVLSAGGVHAGSILRNA